MYGFKIHRSVSFGINIIYMPRTILMRCANLLAYIIVLVHFIVIIHVVYGGSFLRNPFSKVVFLDSFSKL